MTYVYSLRINCLVKIFTDKIRNDIIIITTDDFRYNFFFHKSLMFFFVFTTTDTK